MVNIPQTANYNTDGLAWKSRIAISGAATLMVSMFRHS